VEYSPLAASSSPADSAGSVGHAAVAAAAPPGTRPDVPIVFLHGVGFGVLPYLHLVRQLQQACGQTPFLLVEVRRGVCVVVVVVWGRGWLSRVSEEMWVGQQGGRPRLEYKEARGRRL
jgi:hypothetical protein